MSATRVRGSVPWSSISSRFQPAPTPNSTRPPDRWSTLATSLAVVIGSRWTTRQTPLPIRRRVVAAAAAVIATKRSYVCRYLRGSSIPAGWGVRRLTGMWLCSENHTDSCPRSSSIRASGPGPIASCVAK